MCEECEREADEFAAWCRQAYLDSGGLVIAVAVMGSTGANYLNVQSCMPIDDAAMVLRMAGDPANTHEYVPTTHGGETLQ